jgi:hypothetical protein
MSTAAAETARWGAICSIGCTLIAEILARSLEHFQRQTRSAHAFQVVIEEDFVAADCFSRRDPCVVPARTFLSQLL